MSPSRLVHPHLQNIPLRTDLGAKLRAALRAQQPLPRVLLSADFLAWRHANFVSAYAALAENGVCDPWGSAESRRIHAEWVAAGRPDVEAFVRDRANRFVPAAVVQASAEKR